MYVTWETYLKWVVVVGGNILLIFICGMLQAISPLFWFLMLLSIFILMGGLLIYKDDKVPEELHMTRKMKYRVNSDGDIFVKLPFAWVKTKHHTNDGQLLKFQELKAEYVHSGRGKTYEV